MSVGKRYAYEMAQRRLGDRAEEWLDTPRLGLGEQPSVQVNPRTLLESGCPACIGSVVDVLDAMPAPRVTSPLTPAVNEDCGPGRHHYVRNNRGGGTCRCGDEIGADEL